ncbi:hypothetical protein KVL78_04465 [Helicobacter pylori]|nr:hypothetical protein KVL78_04465 [Helicobacter pylori]
MILRSQTNFVEFLEQVLEVLKEVKIENRMLYSFSKHSKTTACDTRCGEF